VALAALTPLSVAGAVTVADGVNLSIKCPQCGKQTDKSVAWLVDKDALPCAAELLALRQTTGTASTGSHLHRGDYGGIEAQK
jgi:hypothetical protein